MGAAKGPVAKAAANQAGHRAQAGMVLWGETLLHHVLQNAIDVITVFDRTGLIMYQSPSISRILGVNPNLRIGANIFDSALVHPADKAAKRRFLKQLLAAAPGAELHGEFRLRHVDGSYRDIEAAGVNLLDDPTLTGIILSSRDVTDRKAAERALTASEAKYALTFNEAPIGIAHTSPDGHFLLVNQYLCKLLGYTQEALQSMSFQDITESADVDEDVHALQLLREGRISSYHQEKRYIRKDGSRVWINLHAAVQRDENGRVVYFLSTIDDITDRKEAEAAARVQHALELRADALTRQRAQLIKLNQAKDEFVSLASHQLRTPATGVKQYLSLLSEGYAGGLTDEQRQMLDTAYIFNERQLKIVDSLLSVAQLDAGKVRLKVAEGDLTELLSDILEDQRLVFEERGQHVNLEKPLGPVLARFDARLLRMAIENIVDNASKYSHKAKTIEVKLTRSPRQVELTVRDHGVGIPKKSQAHLFKKFSRADNPLSPWVNGSGLGLYWAKKIVDLHHGRIELVSQLRRGSTFTIKLPLEN